MPAEQIGPMPRVNLGPAMTSTVLRRTNRVVALLVLLVTMWTAAHRQPDDDACLPMATGEHDASKHAFAPLGAVDHEHCAVCHWVRALKPEFRVTPAPVAVQAHGDRLTDPAVIALAAPASARIPARAPPALLQQ